MATEGPDLLKTLLLRPGAIYLSHLEVHPSHVDIRGGLVVNTGDRAKAVRASLEKLTALAPAIDTGDVDKNVAGLSFHQIRLPDGLPEVVWGFKDEYLLVGVGSGAVEELVARLAPDAKPATWLAELHAQLPVERPGLVNYLNVEGLRRQAAPLVDAPQAQLILRALGIHNVRSLGSVTGMDTTALSSKTLVTFAGEPAGLMAALAGKPLTAIDLKTIPRDATFAIALRLDLADVYRHVVESASQVNPLAAVFAQQLTGQMDAELGFRVVEDLLEPLGDVWCLYNAPSAGGAILGGTALAVRIRDRERLVRTHDKLLDVVQSQLSRQPVPVPGASTRDAIKEFTFKGQRVYYFQSGQPLPVAPAWCLTDDTLVVALFPQTIKAFLARKADDGSLADVPAVTTLLAAQPGPILVSYEDTTALVDVLYPLVQMLVPVASSALQSSGFDLSVPSLPSMVAIRPYLVPGYSSWRRTAAGVVLERRQSIPVFGTSLDSIAPIAVALLVPAVGSARDASQRAQSSNNVKQIMLAMHTYHDANQTFPPAKTVNKDSKPLLSWRIAILPFVEQQALYGQFHLDEPWDSEHNRKLIPRMPPLYKNPSLEGEQYAGKTNYLVSTGDAGMFRGSKGPGLASITDGTSNTIAVVEVDPDRAVIWTKPDDLEVDPKNPFAGLGKLRPGGFLAAFCDGSVHFLSSAMDGEMLRRAFDPTDGLPVSF